MKNLGKVSNFLEIGQLLFSEVGVHYKIEKDYEGTDDCIIIFYLTRVIDSIVYSAEKQYILHETFSGIMLETSDDDVYFEKYNFSRCTSTTFKDVIS